jgi:hypothetical protein
VISSPYNFLFVFVSKLGVTAGIKPRDLLNTRLICSSGLVVRNINIQEVPTTTTNLKTKNNIKKYVSIMTFSDMKMGVEPTSLLMISPDQCQETLVTFRCLISVPYTLVNRPGYNNMIAISFCWLC